jgi:hypothetical protein
MNIEELKDNLRYLVDKYVADLDKKSELKMLINREGLPPVKGIMSDIVSAGAQVEQTDADLIKDIAFYYI